MKTLLLAALSFTVLAIAPALSSADDAKEPKVAHCVYFALTDNSPAAVDKVVAACKKYLVDHPGELSCTIGTRGKEFARPVNDQDFDVSLQVVFENKAAHDQYAKAERHLKFIAENKENWKKVRVFDSYVAP
jgi:hypothetical protein